MATLPGVRLYRACGYLGETRITYPVGPDLAIEFVPMKKEDVSGE
jgi:hypothetical protein